MRNENIRGCLKCKKFILEDQIDEFELLKKLINADTKIFKQYIKSQKEKMNLIQNKLCNFNKQLQSIDKILTFNLDETISFESTLLNEMND